MRCVKEFAFLEFQMNRSMPPPAAPLAFEKIDHQIAAGTELLLEPSCCVEPSRRTKLPTLQKEVSSTTHNQCSKSAQN